MYTRIVVPLDGSDLAARALPEATMIAQRGALPLHLVRVVDLTRLDRAGGSGVGSRAAVRRLVAEDLAQATDDLAETAAKLRIHGLAVTTEVRQGLVVGELLHVAQPGDLYVLATHGRSGMTRWLLGSVAEEVVRRSCVPVLLVRALVPRRVVTHEAQTPAIVPAAAPQLA